MSRLDIMTPSHAQTVIDGLYRDVERRIAASPPGLCPVDLAKSFLDLCHAQTCGKCVPCRIGLGQLSELMEQVLEGEATMETISIIERVARVIVNSADCAIGRDAARLVLDGVQGFRDDYEEHILRHRCLGGMREPVPCVALCPAGVDIPGYLVLIKYGRYADAVRLIRKDNPFPSACAYICEHPCEARCRRNMIDDAVNIRGLKRYAVDNAGYVPQPDCAEPTGKKVAVIGGGPSGLSAAYYLALMGHKVTVYEKCAKLGGMLRYGIPNYRLPREVLDAEIASMLALGIDVHVNVNVGDDVTFDELRQQNDALYIALGAHTDKKTGIEGEDAEGVISAVEMLREIGDDHMPDFRNKDIVVIGGGSVELCLSIILLDTMLSPVILPLTLRLLCGSVVELDTLGMIRDLFVMIVVPAALAMVLCRLLGQSICAKAKQRLSPFSKLALLVIICANVTRCAPFLHELNRELVLLLCITLAMRLIGLGLGFLLSTLFRFPYPVELTVTVNSSMRNNAAAATLAAQYFPSEVVFSPSVSPLFSQLTSSLAVRALQKRQQKIDHPAS